MPDNLFLEPVEYIFADHCRQRAIFRRLEELLPHVEDASAPALAAPVLEYLQSDLGIHIADEERDLLPILRRRCGPEDGIESILAILSDEHAKDQKIVSDLVRKLHHLVMGEHLPDPRSFADLVHLFLETQKRHMAWEDAMVLPLARRRLLPEDLKKLGKNMAARRSIKYPGAKK